VITDKTSLALSDRFFLFVIGSGDAEHDVELFFCLYIASIGTSPTYVQDPFSKSAYHAVLNSWNAGEF